MLQISWRHGTASEATRSTIVLWYFPCKCLIISTRAQQPLALSFHFYYHCLEGILDFHKTCMSPSSKILSASTWQLWLQHLGIFSQPSGINTIPQNTRWMAEREIMVEQMAYITGHSHLRSSGENTCSLLRARRSLHCGFCLVMEFNLVLRAQEKYILTIIKLEYYMWICKLVYMVINIVRKIYPYSI